MDIAERTAWIENLNLQLNNVIVTMSEFEFSDAESDLIPLHYIELVVDKLKFIELYLSLFFVKD